tara:strand:+ start:472 stop:684 length:213 start_codon:yes stop_codon:yes gene_type:complete
MSDLKSNIKKSTLSDRVHLLETTIINMAESTSIIKANQDKLINNQNKIINDLYTKEEESNEVDESQSTGV